MEALDHMLPPKTVRELARPEQEVKYAAPAAAGGLGRGVQEQRTHDKRGPYFCSTDELSRSATQLGRCLRRYPAVPV